MRVSGSGSAPVVEALESRQMMSASPLIWSGQFNNKLPGYGTYSFNWTSNPNDPAPFTWNYSVVVRRHSGSNAFGGWMWATPDETGPRVAIVGGNANPDGFVHFRIHYPGRKAPFVAQYDPSTKSYDGEFLYWTDHKLHKGQESSAMVGTFQLTMTNPKKF